MVCRFNHSPWVFLKPELNLFLLPVEFNQGKVILSD
jgi:hypothetical protein